MTEKTPIPTMEIPTVFIGKKPIGRYIYACRKAAEKSNTIKITARGTLTSTAVTVAEIFKQNIGKTHKYDDKVEVGSIEMTNKLGRQVFVSTITITITFIKSEKEQKKKDYSDDDSTRINVDMGCSA